MLSRHSLVINDSGYINLLEWTKQLQGRASNRLHLSRRCRIPDSERQLGVEGEIPVLDGKSDPFVPPELKVTDDRVLLDPVGVTKNEINDNLNCN